MHVRGSEWSEERVEKLKALHAKGLSCAMIAYEIGDVSRNAVIGKLHRLGLSSYGSTVHKKAPKRAPRPKPERTVRIVKANGNSNKLRLFTTAKIEVEQLRCAEVDPLNVGLLDLDRHQCRYPANDASPFLFCGHRKMEGSSYCAPHFVLTHRPEVDRRAPAKEAA
jgi:GcrA cell cycle regulator